MAAKKKGSILNIDNLHRVSSSSVLIRDLDKRIYVVPLERLREFRNTDMEASESLVNALDTGERIEGLLNAWLMENYTIKSGD